MTDPSITSRSQPDSFLLEKEELKRSASLQLNASLERPERSQRDKVASTCRILFHHGHDSGLAGQITARDERQGTFLTQAFGLGFDEISTDNLLIVNEDLEVLEGDRIPNPANRFHSWIYRARPDVACIVHTHPMHVCALSITGIPLHIAQMDACMLYDEVAFLPEWPGVPVGNEEGRIIVEALGNKRALVLAHHGLIVAGRSIEEACVLAVQCERAARMQLLAGGAGSIRNIDPALAKEAHDWILDKRRIGAAFDYFDRRSARLNTVRDHE